MEEGPVRRVWSHVMNRDATIVAGIKVMHPHGVEPRGEQDEGFDPLHLVVAPVVYCQDFVDPEPRPVVRVHANFVITENEIGRAHV